MVILAWKIEELNELNETGRQLFSEIKLLKDKIQRDNLETEGNIPSQLQSVRQRLVTLIKGVTRYQRVAASHILVFMISTEERSHMLFLCNACLTRD